MSVTALESTTSYTVTLYDSIQEIPPVEWEAWMNPKLDIAMDQRLLQVMERTLQDQAQFWTAVVRDDRQQSVAFGVFSLFHADIIQSGSPVFQKAVKKLRKYWPYALTWKILFCGLPVPSGHSHLRFAPGVEAQPILEALCAKMQELAKQQGAQMIVFKELDSEQAEQLSSLEELGFHQGELAPIFFLTGRFKSFAEYTAAVRANYRRQIQASVKKFEKAQLTVLHFTDPEKIRAEYTDAVHQLYLNIWERAKEKLECFSADFFRELPLALPGQVAFTLIQKNETPIAFSMGLIGEDIYYNLYTGMDYAMKDTCDLYFNLFYQELHFAFSFQKNVISLGQTSESFKSRLGAKPSQRFFYVRAVNPIIQFGLSLFHRWIFPKLPKVEEKNVFAKLTVKPPAL